MADDEQFSLCWNNFNSNLSAGFHESLCRGDLVDVTLAAEGQFVKAHRLVLSVCSPYFRKMFTQMPANQHAFVFLKDVSHSALKDLIQFMYCGEVNVKQEALPAFISTAEALQIKGLTDSDPPAPQSPAKPTTPAPPPPAASSTSTQQLTSRNPRQRISTSRSYKIESVDDSTDDSKQPAQIVIQTTSTPQQTTIVQHQPQQQTASSSVTQKRPATQRNITAVHTKRVKSSTDPLEAHESSAATTQQITISESKAHAETEFIDLPIELPTKSEPDFSEEAGEVETAEQETAFVEDDSYGDMRYDESYFTETEEAANNTTSGGGNTSATTSKAVIKQSFSDSNYGETTETNEAQDMDPNKFFIITRKGGIQLVFNGFIYRSNRLFKQRKNMETVSWQCIQNANNNIRCTSSVKTIGENVYAMNAFHNHPCEVRLIRLAQKEGRLIHKNVCFIRNIKNEPQ